MEPISTIEENLNDLTPDLKFYERYVFKYLSRNLEDFSGLVKLDPGLRLDSVYFPWNRTFEIGLILKK